MVGPVGILRVVVGIPAFNEERTIAKVVVRSQKYADRILVIDDGSVDDTLLIAESLGAEVIRHDKNLGKSAALQDCLKWAKQDGTDILVTIDADGKHDPTKIPVLIDALETNQADIVVGSRAKPPEMERQRSMDLRKPNSANQQESKGKVIDAQSGFRVYSREAIERLTMTEWEKADTEMLKVADRTDMRIIEVPVSAVYSDRRPTSHNRFMRALDVTFDVLRFISIRHPLLFYGGFSIIALTISVIFGVMTLDYYQRWGIVITNIALVSIATGILGFLALFTGIILFTLITVIRQTSPS